MTLFVLLTSVTLTSCILPDNEREAIYSVRDELNQERTKIQELLQSLESERRMSNELGQNMQHMRETEQKCKELGRQVKGTARVLVHVFLAMHVDEYYLPAVIVCCRQCATPKI